jgi:hypothetical protein
MYVRDMTGSLRHSVALLIGFVEALQRRFKLSCVPHSSAVPTLRPWVWQSFLVWQPV